MYFSSNKLIKLGILSLSVNIWLERAELIFIGSLLLPDESFVNDEFGFILDISKLYFLLKIFFNNVSSSLKSIVNVGSFILVSILIISFFLSLIIIFMSGYLSSISIKYFSFNSVLNNLLISVKK
jgi:hypothetical protein